MAKKANAQALAAGVVATGGAVAAAGKLVHDRAQRRRRRFRIGRDEPAAEGVRRIARGQLEIAGEELGRRADGIHEARKALKRVRAVVRLARDSLGDEAYRRENRAFRDAGRDLSAVRDAQVLGETLDDVRERYADELPDGAFLGLRTALATEAEAAHAGVSDAAIDELAATLEEERTRVATWPLDDGDDPRTLIPGLRRIYRRGRRAARVARAEPTTEHLHELRKRAKDLWHAAQVMRPLAPDRLDRVARRAHKLANRLGDDHDLAVLLDAAHDRTATLRAGELELLEALVHRRRAKLQRSALRRAARLYRRSPKAWVRTRAGAG